MTHTILMPDLGQTTAEGKILRWLKNPGEKVSKGDHLLEVETDKVTMEVESYASGYLRQALASEGQMVSAMAPIALVTDTLEESVTRSEPMPATKASGAAADRASSRAQLSAPPGLAVVPGAKMLAKELGIDLASVRGTGPGGLITRKDIERASRDRSAPKPLAAMAALVTRSMQTIPHFYLSADVDVSAAECWREKWNASHPDLHATLNDVFVRAASQALHDVPRLNVSYYEGKYEPKQDADVLLVMALESGLMLVAVADPGWQSGKNAFAACAGLWSGPSRAE